MDVLEKEQVDEQTALNHWYYKSKFALLKKTIKECSLPSSSFSTVDVGTGLGLFLRMMELEGLASPERSVGVDPARPPGSFALNSKIPVIQNFPDRQFDLAILMDVLEHVDDDASLLKESASHVKSGGFIFVTVPALPWLWSSHDIYLNHYRRYSLSNLKKLIQGVETVGLVSLHYFFFSPLLIACPIRIIRKHTKNRVGSDMAPVPTPLNSFFKLICMAELVATKRNTFAGLTAVATCKVK